MIAVRSRRAASTSSEATQQVFEDQPILIVLACAGAAAAMSGCGALSFLRGGRVPRPIVAAAYALASGLMLAAGYLLMEEGLVSAPVSTIGAAVAGAGYSYWTHRYAQIGQMALSPTSADAEIGGYKLLLQHGLHAATEGVAIGAAMAVDLRLGVFMAATLAVHNVAEGIVLSEALRARGVSMGDTIAMSMITKVPQALLAVSAFALVPAVPGWLPLALGLSAGSLLYLVLTELLPGSYQRAGSVVVAVVVSTSAAAVVLLRQLFG